MHIKSVTSSIEPLAPLTVSFFSKAHLKSLYNANSNYSYLVWAKL